MSFKLTRNNVLSKKDFIKVMEEIKRQYDFYDALNDVFDKYDTDNSVYNYKSMDICISLLSAIFHDDNDWIGYWIFELNMGKSFELGDVLDEEGNAIDISTIEKFYDFLIKNMWEDKVCPSSL